MLKANFKKKKKYLGNPKCAAEHMRPFRSDKDTFCGAPHRQERWGENLKLEWERKQSAT